MNKYFRKALYVFMIVTLLGLVGCNSSEKTETDNVTDNTLDNATDKTDDGDSTASQTDEQITLRFSWWGGEARHEALLNAIKIYEDRNQNIKIEAEYSGYDGYYEKMMTTLSSGTAPDLFQFMTGWVPDVQVAKHYLADLSLLPIDTSTLKEGLIERSGTYNGEAVLLPVSVGGSTIYVNTKFASEFGVELDKAYTWEELKELGRSIHERDSEAYLMTADIDVLNKLFLTSYMAQQIGDSMVSEETYEVNFTVEQLEAAIQNIVDFYEIGAIEPFEESSVFVGQMDQNVKWINGKIGMLIDYTGAFEKYAKSIADPVDVLAIPVIEDAKNSGVSFGGDRGVSINDNSQYKEEAAKFLDFLINDEEAIIAQGTNFGYCPTDNSEEILVEQGVVDEVQRKAVKLCEINAYTENSLSTNTSLETIRRDVLEEVLYKDKTVEEGATEIFNEYQRILQELKEDK